ncbi:hypothetical protein [Brunnivagina elsteri]|nr:hypothetical protein [Calothrix elsteri]
MRSNYRVLKVKSRSHGLIFSLIPCDRGACPLRISIVLKVDEVYKRNAL